jgi:hypothetical protein
MVDIQAFCGSLNVEKSQRSATLALAASCNLLKSLPLPFDTEPNNRKAARQWVSALLEPVMDESAPTKVFHISPAL